MRIRSLWRCPTCLYIKRPAFSLHSVRTNLTRCPNCHSFLLAQTTRGPPYVRKVAIIFFENKDTSRILDELNSAQLQATDFNIVEHLNRLKEEGLIKEIQLTVPVDKL